MPVGQQHLNASATGSPATTRRAPQAAQPAPLAVAAGQALLPAAPSFISTTLGQVLDQRVGQRQATVGPSPVHTSRLSGPVRRAHSLEILEYVLKSPSFCLMHFTLLYCRIYLYFLYFVSRVG